MSDPAVSVKLLSCPGCGGTIELRAAGYSVSLICGHCHVTLDMTAPEPRLIAQAAEALSTPWLPLGSRGTLAGIEWEVIGYMERASSSSYWSEYLLFNPYHGYRFLVDDDRSWSFGQVLDVAPKHNLRRAVLNGREHEEFDSAYRASVRFVVGEFYWRVTVGEAVMVRDFVRPGTMLSREENDNEVTWTRLDIVPRGGVEDAFGFRPRQGRRGAPPSPHEPSPYGPQLKGALIVAFLAFVALLFAPILAPDSDYLESHMSVTLGGPASTVTMGPLTIVRHSAVGIYAETGGLNNAWVDLDYSLVNRKTQESYDAYGLAESYSGVDSDGTSWHEGNSVPETRLSAVPPGDYDLLVEATATRWGEPSYYWTRGDETIPIRIVVQRGASFSENFWTALLLVLAWPALLIGLHYNFEARRREQEG